jgi:restriction endonuclease S subunit
MSICDLVPIYEVLNSFMYDNFGSSLRYEPSKNPDKIIRYIGMEHIEKNSGILLDMPEIKGIKIKSQTINVPSDFFIYGKLRPYLNKYWQNKTEFQNITCSSEFFVFSIKANVDSDYFRSVLSSSIIQYQIEQIVSGARMPRINETQFKNILFPLPKPVIQQEISEQIKTWKTQIKTLREQSKANKANAIKEFEKEIFEL